MALGISLMGNFIAWFHMIGSVQMGVGKKKIGIDNTWWYSN